MGHAGLHDFTNDGLTNFPTRYQNTDVWVVDPVTKQSWKRSLTDASSGLSQSQIDGLSSTATQYYQDGNALLVNGGYVYDSTNDDFTTYNTMSAINLPNLVDWVKGTDSSLNSNAILQVEGLAATDSSYEGGFFQITGGELHKLGDRYHLVFGQNFEGGYTPGRNGVYSSQVRSFDLTYDFGAGTIGYDNASATASDDTQFRRRDLNVVPVLSPDGSGGETESLVALSGVFYNGSGVWTVPVEIGADGIPTMVDPSTDPNAFKQALQQYASATIGLYSQSNGEMTEILLGGISANTYDATTGELTYDSNYGFTNQISAVLRDADGVYTQEYIGEYPWIESGTSGIPLLFGASGEFFLAEGIQILSGGIIDLDALTETTTIGYIFGGIAADQPNFGNSVASSYIFEVVYSPIPEPSQATLLAVSAGFLILISARRRKAS